MTTRHWTIRLLQGLILAAALCSMAMAEEGAQPSSITGTDKAAEPWQFNYNGNFAFQYYSGMVASIGDFIGEIWQGNTDYSALPPNEPFSDFLLSMDEPGEVIPVPMIPNTFNQACTLSGDSLLLHETSIFLGKQNQPLGPFVIPMKELDLSSAEWHDFQIDFTLACADVKGAILGGFAIDTDSQSMISVLGIKKETYFSRLVICQAEADGYSAASWVDLPELTDFTLNLAILNSESGKTVCIAQYGYYAELAIQEIPQVSSNLQGDYDWRLITLPDSWADLGSSDTHIYYMDEDLFVHSLDSEGTEEIVGQFSEDGASKFGDENTLCLTYRFDEAQP